MASKAPVKPKNPKQVAAEQAAAAEAQAARELEEKKTTIKDTLQQIVENSVSIAHERTLWKIAEEKAKEELLKEVASIMTLHALQPDGDMENAHLNPLWTAENTPMACEIDQWARGIVPVKKRPKQSNTQHTRRTSFAITSAAAKLSMASKESKWDTASVASRRSSVGKASAAPNRKLVSATTTGKEAAGNKSAASVPRVIKPPSEQEAVDAEIERTRQRELRKIERQKLAADLKQKEAERQKEEEEKLSRMQQNLKGKTYTYDENGNILLVNTLTAEKLPSVSCAPFVKVKAREDEEGQSTAKGRGAKGQSARRTSAISMASTPLSTARTEESKESQTKTKKSMQNARANNLATKVPSEEKAFNKAVQSAVSQQPSLLETIQLGPGVQVRDAVSGASKKGPPIIPNNSQGPTALTRTEFWKILDAQQQKKVVEAKKLSRTLPLPERKNSTKVTPIALTPTAPEPTLAIVVTNTTGEVAIKTDPIGSAEPLLARQDSRKTPQESIADPKVASTVFSFDRKDLQTHVPLHDDAEPEVYTSRMRTPLHKIRELASPAGHVGMNQLVNKPENVFEYPTRKHNPPHFYTAMFGSPASPAGEAIGSPNQITVGEDAKAAMDFSTRPPKPFVSLHKDVIHVMPEASQLLV